MCETYIYIYICVFERYSVRERDIVSERDKVCERDKMFEKEISRGNAMAGLIEIPSSCTHRYHLRGIRCDMRDM